MQEKQFLGNLFIVTAPSGAGKTSLVQAWLEQSARLNVSVSYTTRPKRNGEVDGKNYHFVDKPTFENMIAQQALFEYATVFDHYYGTAKQGIFEQLQADQDVVLEIDWQGAKQIREIFKQAISIFILPPSLSALKERLQGRGREDEAEIDRRLAEAKNEISHYHEADYLIINDDFDTALNELMVVQQSASLQAPVQQARYEKLLQNLLN